MTKREKVGMKEVEQVEMTENLEFAPCRPYAPDVVISTAGRNLKRVKSQKGVISGKQEIFSENPVGPTRLRRPGMKS
jgi:hypothetical protein